MGLEKRLALYKELETLRGHPLIVYCTSSRAGALDYTQKNRQETSRCQIRNLKKGNARRYA